MSQISVCFIIFCNSAVNVSLSYETYIVFNAGQGFSDGIILQVLVFFYHGNNVMMLVEYLNR